MAIEVEERGPFTRDEIPEDVVMRFRRPEAVGGGPVNLTGYSAEVDIQRPGQTTITRSALISDATNGEVRYTWQGDDLSLDGVVRVQFWAFSGTPENTRIASKIVALQVFDGPRHEA